MNVESNTHTHTHKHTHTPLPLLNKPYITAFLYLLGPGWEGRGGDRGVGDDEEEEAVGICACGRL